MEVNTRIQVEHRVSELCYGLRFTNPDDPSDSFEVDSLVEAMVLSRGTRRAPAEARRACAATAPRSRRASTRRTARSPRTPAASSAGRPIEGEIRDDQGICA
jgi:hypothetical protein